MTESEAITAAQQQLHSELAAACAAAGGERFNLEQTEGTTSLVMSGRRFLSFRLTPPPPTRASSGFVSESERLQEPTFNVAIDICGGCTIDGRLPPVDYYQGGPHRFLTMQGMCDKGEVVWNYRCPRYFLSAMPVNKRRPAIDLTSAQLTLACLRLLALAPVFPPENLTVARAMYSV